MRDIAKRLNKTVGELLWQMDGKEEDDSRRDKKRVSKIDHATIGRFLIGSGSGGRSLDDSIDRTLLYYTNIKKQLTEKNAEIEGLRGELEGLDDVLKLIDDICDNPNKKTILQNNSVQHKVRNLVNEIERLKEENEVNKKSILGWKRRADSFEAKASKLNAEKRKLLELAAKASVDKSISIRKVFRAWQEGKKK